MAPLATAYGGPPKFTLARAFTQWRLDVPMLVLILLAAAWYLAGARRVRKNGGQWGSGRTFAFLVLGLGSWAVATMAWPGAYESVLFYARATQTVLLVLVSPLFLALGKPLTLLIEACPRAGRPLERAVRSRVAKVVMFPAVTTLLLIAVPMSMYFTSWYTAFFSSGAVRELTYLILMVPGYAFFWTLLRVDPVPREYPYGVGMWIAAAEVVGDGFFGIAVIADQTLLGAAHYRAAGYPFGPSLATAQVIGGGIIWVLGDFVGLPFLGVQLVQMMRADKREAAEIDAELDARDAARAAARAARASEAPGSPVAGAAAAGSPAGSRELAGGDAPRDDAGPAAVAADESGADRPWWESDPRLTDRFKRA
jgi:cytochrome c oxidase assembly factor CtaG